jgi:hypothetical protein
MTYRHIEDYIGTVFYLILFYSTLKDMTSHRTGRCEWYTGKDDK